MEREAHFPGHMRMHALAIIIPLIAFVGCSPKSPGGTNDNTHTSPINQALEQLRTRTTENAFVVVEDPTSNRFVQFSVRGEKEVYFDFPIRTASLKGEDGKLKFDIPVSEIPVGENLEVDVFMPPEEANRLQNLLQRRGLTSVQSRMAGHSGDGRIKAYMESVEGTFSNLAEGKAFVDDVFTDVYLMKPPSNYRIEQN